MGKIRLFLKLKLICIIFLCCYFQTQEYNEEPRCENFDIEEIEEDPRKFLSEIILQGTKSCQALVSLSPDFYDVARKDCSDVGGHFPEEHFQINITSLYDDKNISAEAVTYVYNRCFWTNANITADGIYSGPDEFKELSTEKVAFLESNKELEIKVRDGNFCLSLPPESQFKTAKVEANFFCEGDVYDERGRVKMYVGQLDSCEHLKLNLTFIMKHGLFIGQHHGKKYVIQNYQRRSENWTRNWSIFKSGWRTNESFEDSEIDLCSENLSQYNVQYCVRDENNEEEEVRIGDPGTRSFTGAYVCIKTKKKE